MSSLLIAVPVYGQIEYTHALVKDLRRENATFVIIDNRGDYIPLADERVVTPGRNLGWAGGSNLGFRIAFSDGHTHAMTLNNDTRLSRGFLDAVTDPQLPFDAGIVVPVYDDAYGHRDMKTTYSGPAKDYVPVDRYRKCFAVDGTAVTITKDTWLALGGYDERNFGSTGWGADVDFCIRATAEGFGSYVTERAFINHFGRATAIAMMGNRKYLAKSAVGMVGGVLRLHRGNVRKWLSTPQPTVHEFERSDAVSSRGHVPVTRSAQRRSQRWGERSHG
ncbi:MULTISPECIES: glycosyltransferase family 2 protein [unclassified Rhodococcus (in: high G+C Gram-positive bacteria)]|uniref:glycosyltransferase family 2 protein n=1 Tax=unclassified Rhodococcus (in: high G+C Gram-positive bacteria) TaxID=192944 RepID=UPI0019109920|nr:MULTISPECIES: glycosyltransferase family 2 protein [unclassified Rhodococcus (in: high G+C Gram-positive bacteria)]